MTIQQTFGNLSEDLAIGTVLCAIEEPYEDATDIYINLPQVRVSTVAGDKAVYGTFGGWAVDEFELHKNAWSHTIEMRPWLSSRVVSTKDTENDQVVVKIKSARVVTAGPSDVRVIGTCEIGDLLMTSDVDGVAIVAPENTDVRYVLGKVYANKNTDDVSTVPAVIWAG